ncbi:MAG: hypothetical protein ACJA10_000435 [Oleispira sp.]|jgi:hypothetical protein
MSNLYQLTYASQANVGLDEKGVNLEVGRILTKSKSNNAQLNIGGVLYYADGYFFQVLEGEREAVQNLYEKIARDERHSDAKILLEGFIDNSQFFNWTMHFVPSGSSIRELLKDYGLSRFTPFIFSKPLVNTLIEVLSMNGQYISKNTAKSKNATSGILSKFKRLFS